MPGYDSVHARVVPGMYTVPVHYLPDDHPYYVRTVRYW